MAIDRLELSEAQREEFARLTDQLRTRSKDLAEAAPRLSLAQMRDRMQAIQASCMACHDRFRIPR